MLTFPRSVARRFRAACQRLAPGRGHRGPAPPVTLVGGPDGLRLRFAFGAAAVEYRHPGPCDAGQAVLPLARIIH